MTAPRPTDLERLRDLLLDWGVEFDRMPALRSGEVIGIEEGTPAVEGYSGFACYFHFDNDGKFQRIVLTE